MNRGFVQAHRRGALVLRLAARLQATVRVGGEQDFGIIPRMGACCIAQPACMAMPSAGEFYARDQGLQVSDVPGILSAA